MLEGWDEERAGAVLAAMADVAALGEHERDTPRRLVRATAEHLFDLDVDPDDLPGIDPGGLAAALASHDDRWFAVQLLVLVPYADTTLQDPEVDRVDEYAAALGAETQMVRDLHKVRKGHIRRLMVDYFRRAAEGVQMPDDHRGIVRRTWDEVHQYVGDAKVAERYLPLAGFAEGTLGRTFYDFYRARGFSLPGEKHSLGEEVVSHDCCHILSGMNTDGAGEIDVAGFEAGMKHSEYGWEMMLEVILDFQLGIDFGVGLVGYVPKVGEFDPDLAMVGIRRGLVCNVDIMSAEWDFWEVADVPVVELRDRYGISGVEGVVIPPPERPATSA